MTTTPPEIVRWPRDADRRTELAARRVPRLLLLDDDTTPPTIDDDEDWIRASAGERDTWARLQALALRATGKRRRPRLTDDTQLHYDGHHVSLATGDSRLVGLLVDRFGTVVLWTDITGALRPDGRGTKRQATARLSRLRARLAPIGLTIDTSRGHGILLDHKT